MNKVSFIELLVKQTSRRAAYEFELESKQKQAWSPEIVKAVQDDVGIYSLKFLKALHDNTRDSLYKLMKTKDPNDPNSVEVPVGLNWLDHNDFAAPEREALLNFSYKVKDMAPSNSKNWIDLRHFMHYVYRNFFASFSLIPSNECLTPYFLDEMRGLVRRKSGLHLERFDHHLFRLLGDPYFRSAGPILDNDAQCICAECLVGKYAILIHAVENQLQNELLRSTCRVIFCRRCRTLLELDRFHAHVATVHWAANEVKAAIKDNTTKVGQSLVLCEEPPEVSQRIPMSEEATDAAAMTICDIHFSIPKHDFNDLTCTRLTFEEFLKQFKDSTKHDDAVENKEAIRKCINITKDTFSKVVFDDSILNPNTFASNLTPSVSPTKKKAEPSLKPKEIPKTSRKTERRQGQKTKT
uniref:Uncharacterized protein LOC114339115 isoform X1 n=1 Tax=Diabrotica virgifera virgifera TaxID=50390 RepID=A0A6P7G8P4_DIAVI